MTNGKEIQRPRVLLSVATSIDGFIDDAGPDRLLLSNEADFDRVDEVRAGVDAILLGAGALRADDPRVVIRDGQRRAARVTSGKPEHPLKVTITASGRLDADLRWFHTGGDKVVYTTDAGAAVLAAEIGPLADVVSLGPEIDLARLLADLGHRGVAQLMVEGGEQVHTSLLAAGFVDEIHLAVAPLLVGDGPRFVGQARFPWPTATRWELADTITLGDVVVLRYLVNHDETRDLAWLRRAIALAERCPPSQTAFSVGASIVDDNGRELAFGFSRETDDHVHAEESALAKLSDVGGAAGGDVDLTTATIYSSLEPCAARASRPTPCAQLIINSGIRRVVMAWSEPSDFVEAPDGIAVLEAAGVEVIQLSVEDQANYRP